MKSVEPLSPRAYQLAEEYQLGEPRAEFRNGGSKDFGQSVLIAFAGAVTLASWFFLVRNQVFYSSAGAGSSGSDNSLFQNFLPCLGGFLLLIGLGNIYLGIQTLVVGEVHIYICSDGFIFANRRKVGWVVRKEEVASFQQRITIEPQGKQKKASQEKNPYRTLYTIVTKTGQSYNLSTEPGEVFVDELVEAWWPETLDAYQGGKELDFGWLLMSQEGLRLDTRDMTSLQEPRNTGNAGKQNFMMRLVLKQLDSKLTLEGSCIETGERFITWNEIDLPWLDEQRRALIIERKSLMEPWAVVPLHRIANTKLCSKLVKYALEEEAWKL